MAAKRKSKAPARAALESLRSIVVELRELERTLWYIQQQARCIPPEATDSVDALLGRTYRQHATRLKAMGIVTADPDSDTLRELLDALKVVAKGFGADIGDTYVLPRARPTIWTDNPRLYSTDGRKAVLCKGLRLHEDGSLASSPGSMRDW